MTPLLLSGVGRFGIDKSENVLGSDPRIANPGVSSTRVHPLLIFYKLAVLLENPHLLQFLDASHLFYFSYMGFDGSPPPYSYVPEADPENFILNTSRAQWIREIWRIFSRSVKRQRPEPTFYAGSVPSWFPAELRQVMPSICTYCFQDPRDAWLSAKAQIGKGPSPSPRMDDHALARNIALEFVQNFENYFDQRSYSDVRLLHWEDISHDAVKVVRGADDPVKPGAVSGWSSNSGAALTRLQSSVQLWKQLPLPNEVTSLLLSTISGEMSWLGYEVPLENVNQSRCLRFDKRMFDLSKLRVRQARLELQDDFSVVHVQGRDCHLRLPFEPFDADEVKNIWVSLNTDVGEVCSIYWRSPDARFSEERVCYLRLTPNRHWTVLSFPVHTHPLWKGRIAELRLDLFNIITRGWLRRWRSPYPPHRGVGKIRWVKLVP